MAKKQNIDEMAQAIDGPSDYRRVVNLTNRPMNGLPIGDGTTISMTAGPYSKGDTHISRSFLAKYVGSYLKRLAKEGKIQIVADRGGV